ncbi:MAG: hypothetical protein FJ160_00115 [Gammaproteobacteria bacterium]|nr:hypothetical protein [Gammaproteobacteria bacterium]
MDYFIVRSFDHVGYYETRLVLLLIGLALVTYAAVRKRDYRYALAFASGVVFQSLLEWLLAALGLRGRNYSLSLLGVTFSATWSIVWQGLAEGGILSLMAFWFADLFHFSKDQAALPRRAFYAVCVVIVVLAGAVGVMARGLPISSPRPMFAPLPMTISVVTIAVSALLISLKGCTGWRALGWFYLGLLVYVVLTFEPLHVLGARYVAVRTAEGGFAAAPWLPQIGLMLYSHLYEVAGGKIYYFVVPYVLGLLNSKGGKHA